MTGGHQLPPEGIVTELQDNQAKQPRHASGDGARSREEDARARLAAIVESSDDAIISKSLDGIIRTWNRGAERIFGYTAAEAIGRPITMLMPPDRVSEERVILERLRRGDRVDHYETIRVRKDGVEMHVSLTVSPIRDSRGNVVGASKIARDITSRKAMEAALRESEARLRAVVETTPECVKIVSPEGEVLFINPGGAQLLDADDTSSLIGRKLEQFVVAEHRDAWRNHHARVCAGEKLVWQFETIGLRGTRRWMETHPNPLPLPDGRNGQLAVTRDITGRKMAEIEREQLLESERAARAEAERIGLLKDEFLATLSHELRTPLNAILGWSQVLRTRTHQPDEITEGLAVIERNARVQTQLIEDLLDMSRIISGKIRLEVQQVDLQEVIKAAVASVRHSADAKDIRIHMLMDPLAGPVRGDPSRLQQCFWNLLSNAIKFTPKGGRVQVSLERVNSQVEVCVSDNGQGIKPEFMPHLFERFRQADASTTRRHGGLGLGLSIVKHLVELHGGTVRARSPGEGQGATFCISLPLMPVHRGQDEHREHPRSAITVGSPSTDHPSLKGITVLAVDDEPDARDLVRRFLEDCGARVIVASSAEEGLQLLTTERPDMILSDIGMPDMDGYEFIRRVRALGPELGGRTPAAALTAFARTEDRTRALRAGYQTHVAKPVEPAELTAVVASLSSK
jgi:PAS domain S-box-containing protein